MTKLQFITFCKMLGCSCNYSGKTNTMFVSSPGEEDILLLAIQEFGLIPDFKVEYI